MRNNGRQQQQQQIWRAPEELCICSENSWILQILEVEYKEHPSQIGSGSKRCVVFSYVFSMIHEIKWYKNHEEVAGSKASGLKMVDHSRRRQPSSGRQPSPQKLSEGGFLLIAKLFFKPLCLMKQDLNFFMKKWFDAPLVCTAIELKQKTPDHDEQTRHYRFSSLVGSLQKDVFLALTFCDNFLVMFSSDPARYLQEGKTMISYLSAETFQIYIDPCLFLLPIPLQKSCPFFEMTFIDNLECIQGIYIYIYINPSGADSTPPTPKQTTREKMASAAKLGLFPLLQPIGSMGLAYTYL